MERPKFGPKFPQARAWWKRYKLKRKVKELEAEVKRLREERDDLAKEKRGLWVSYMQELGTLSMEAEHLRDEIKVLKRKLQPPVEDTTLQEGTTLRRIIRRMGGGNNGKA